MPSLKWARKARWGEDGKYVTSSGVSAGMDMALAVISKRLGIDVALAGFGAVFMSPFGGFAR